MERYVFQTTAFSFLVDLLLLIAAGRFCGQMPNWYRVILSAVIGSIYSWLCLTPGWHLLGSVLPRFGVLVLMGMIAFGYTVSALRRMAVFVLLVLALEGLALGVGTAGLLSSIGGVLGIGLVCYLGFREQSQSPIVDVELRYGDSYMKLQALRDTGNTLRDPLTGHQILVVGADVASKMTGLSPQQLQTPVETMGVIPGLRLIPYRTVGQSAGLLLALRFPWIRIGSWEGSGLVAFAPEGISTDGSYQALTGGMV